MYKIQVVGDGSFGRFLKEEIFEDHLSDNGDTIILAVPLSAYEECVQKYKGKHLVNVCSVQLPSTRIIQRYTTRFTSIHPLFGRRTPKQNRSTIITCENGGWEEENFLKIYHQQFTNIAYFTPEEHDKLMLKTHYAAVKAAQYCQQFIDNTQDIPDDLIPNSFRLLREFVKTLRDMPQGTLDSIMANPYISDVL